MSKPEPFEGEDCVCSFGMKLTWDINDPKLPQDTKQFDAFQEWTDGYVRFIYNAEDKNAQRHLSGWAMRNTNNHNCQILKKSCLGVVVCSRSCTLSDGSKLQLRPAICDKARQKQQKKLCPSCNSCLELMPCRGHSGYPVTNFWRVDTKAIFFQAKGVHDHPRPESKSETEARRSAVKRRMSSPHFTTKRRLVEPEASRYDLGPTFNLHQLSCMDPPERYSTNYPLQSSHYPAFQSNYDPHNALGEAAPTLQKPANHRLFMTRPPCGYEFPVPSYLGSGSYSALSGLPYKEASSHTYREAASSPQDQLTDPSKGSSGLGSGIAPTTPHPSNSPYDSTASSKHHSWKQLLGKGSAPYGDLSAPTANHHYYSPEFPCRYPGASNPAALQTIITTTTKVSYQPCPKPPGALPSCSSLLEDPPSYSELKIPEDSSGVIKSAMAFQPEALPAKMERLEGYQGYDSYRYSGYQGYRYEAGEY